MDRIGTHGLHMPQLGLGTFRMEGCACQGAIEGAIGLGYSHIDTATKYGNEAAVGDGVASSGIARGDLHITTKLRPEDLTVHAARRALETSLTKLRTDYVDLYLIHWPTPAMDLPAVLALMIEFKAEGLVRAIGVANFTMPLLRRAVEEVGAPIAVNQIEYHVLLSQARILAYARGHGITVTAYSPLGVGQLVGNPTLDAIGRRHGVDGTRVALKWLVDQPGVAAVPKAQTHAHQASNLAAMELVLTNQDRLELDDMANGTRVVDPPHSPVWDLPG